ncbi:MAG: response regulator [Bacteroidota bacterium]
MKKIDQIMLIDDDEVTNFYHQFIIEEANCCKQIQIFKDSQNALSFLQDTKNPMPNIIFLDINMPVMNGWEFLDKYKKLDTKRKRNAVVVMLTTSTNKNDKEKSKTYREVAHFYSKPLTEKTLFHVMKNM